MQQISASLNEKPFFFTEYDDSLLHHVYAGKLNSKEPFQKLRGYSQNYLKLCRPLVMLAPNYN